MTQGTLESTVWEQVSLKTVIGSGGSFRGPYEADLQIGITSTGRIAGRRQSGTSGVEFAVGGVVDGLDITFWIIKDQPPSELDRPYFGEYTGQFASTDMEEASGTWEDIHGNEGTFTLTKVVS